MSNLKKKLNTSLNSSTNVIQYLFYKRYSFRFIWNLHEVNHFIRLDIRHVLAKLCKTLLRLATHTKHLLHALPFVDTDMRGVPPPRKCTQSRSSLVLCLSLLPACLFFLFLMTILYSSTLYTADHSLFVFCYLFSFYLFFVHTLICCLNIIYNTKRPCA